MARLSSLLHSETTRSHSMPLIHRQLEMRQLQYIYFSIWKNRNKNKNKTFYLSKNSTSLQWFLKLKWFILDFDIGSAVRWSLWDCSSLKYYFKCVWWTKSNFSQWSHCILSAESCWIVLENVLLLLIIKLWMN